MQNFMVTDIVHCAGNTVDDIVVLLRLHPTYEVPHSGGSRTPTSAPSPPRRRVMTVGSTATSRTRKRRGVFLRPTKKYTIFSSTKSKFSTTAMVNHGALQFSIRFVVTSFPIWVGSPSFLGEVTA
ncbi:hypothetical protein B0H13DRAFT_1871838 [Mycena leptocephala]|nr:hypothetical protein B0H13DRAFT_1871838 [Mycena leptocephala]